MELKNKILKPILLIIGLLWLIFLIGKIVPFNISEYGIEPRVFDFSNALGIFTHILIHGDLKHLTSNSIFLSIALCLALRNGYKFTFNTIIYSLIIGYIGIWLFGEVGGGHHIGISGVIMGMFAFMGSFIIYDRNYITTSNATIIFIFFTPIVFASLINFKDDVSFTGHLFGFIGGLIGAYIVGTNQWRNFMKDPIEE